MRFWPNMKMKYKMILLFLLPSFIFMGFITHYLINDYQRYGRMKSVHEVASISNEVGNLLIQLQKEKDATLISRSQNNLIENQRIAEIQRQTDRSFAAFQQEVQNIPYTINGITLETAFSRLIKNFDQIQEKRNLPAASSEEIAAYYNNLQQDGIAGLSTIANNSVDMDVSNSILAYAYLLQEILAGSNERRLGYIALSQEGLTSDSYQAFLIEAGKQEAFRNAFIELSSKYDTILANNLTNSSADQESLRKSIIQTNRSQQNSLTPQTWWESKTQQLAPLITTEQQVLEESERVSEMIKNRIFKNLMISSSIILVTIVATFTLILLTLRSLASRLEHEVELLSTSGHEILNSVTETTSGTAETATAVTETTTTVEELKQTGDAASEKVKNVAKLANNALGVLEQSEKSLQATIDGMNKIQEGMGTISESIIKLSDHSHAIGNIIDTVNDLAEQSHLLAVNASIEAAKAGEQGKGFAVVAQEVRSLAEQSKQATVQVRNILNDIQNATSSAVMATEQGSKAVQSGMEQSNRTNEAIRSIAKEINDVVQASSQISVSNQQQMIGVEQVNIAMENIKEASNQQVQNMRQIEVGLQSLNKVGISLKGLVQEYKL